jgi:hypothetical protein
MNAMAPTPPLTSWSDVALLGMSCLALAAFLHGVRGRKEGLSQEVVRACRGHAIPDALLASLGEDPVAALRRYHRSGAAFLLTCLPFVIMVAGFTGCSLLRDAGYEIFPWPLLAVCLASGLSFGVAIHFRQRSILRLLLCRMKPASQAAATPDL